jgi:hypothetical protein
MTKQHGQRKAPEQNTDGQEHSDAAIDHCILAEAGPEPMAPGQNQWGLPYR